MAQFDLEKAAAVLAKGNTGVIDALGLGFGVPNCILNMTKSALSILPSQVLANMSNILKEGRDSANQVTSDIVKNLFLDSGIVEFDTDTGKLKLISSSSKFGLDKNEQKLIKGLESINEALAFGSTLWANMESIQDQIDEIKYCFGLLEQSQKFCGGNSSNFKRDVDYQTSDLPTTQAEQESNYADLSTELTNAVEYAANANSILEDISEILQERVIDPSKEPEFYTDIELPDFFKTVAAGETSKVEDVFDLIFGPPKSKSGQFILTTDGYYYNYTSALDINVNQLHAASIPAKGKKWLFNFDPNLGGKGDKVSLNSISKFVDTIFDLNKIDDGTGMKTWYDEDHFLQVLIGQKDKQIYDISGQIAELTFTETTSAIPGENSAIVINLKKSLNAIISTHMNKINRRKKQIEIAVKAPDLYGKGSKFSVGQIPINDFSYLGDINLPLALEKQNKLIFRAGEVSGVVLPIKPKFVMTTGGSQSLSLNNLLVPPVGKGSIITSTSGVLSSGVTLLSLTDDIVTDKLLTVYNFLDSKTSRFPDSDKFTVLNCNNNDMYGNAQLIAHNASAVFPLGLSIPYLEGVGNYDPVSLRPSSVGSYIRLPDIAEFRNLGYNAEGFSLDFWLHVPDVSSAGWNSGLSTSSLHRLIFACENTGGSLSSSNPNKTPISLGFDSVRGMVVGLTRDQQITKNIEPSDSETDNNLSSIFMYIAPTQSVNTNDVVFINNTKEEDGCVTGIGYHYMGIDIMSIVNVMRFYQMNCEFVHTVFSIDPINNEVRLYCDGILMTTSSISQTFGTKSFAPPQLPSFHAPSSFNYATYDGVSGTPLAKGPSLNPHFTPWIIGGGYTDGLVNHGGFMGNGAGRTSGLRGYLGSFKIYNKALNNNDVLKNFNAQEAYFKNLAPGCGPVISTLNIDFSGIPTSGDLPLTVVFDSSGPY